MVRNLVTHILWMTGLSSLARRLLVRKGRFVLMFHGVSAQKRAELPKDSQPYLSAPELDSIFSWLQQRFDFLTPDAFLATSRSGILLTFDDGLANNRHIVVPVLEKFQAPAVFFVSTQHVADPNNWLPATRRMAGKAWKDESMVPVDVAAEFYDGMMEEDIIWCANHPLVTVGGHSHSHPFLTQCSDPELQREIADSKSYLEGLTKTRLDLFAYPTGDYNRRVAEVVREAGYRAAFVMEDPLPVGLPHFEIPRIGIYEAHPAYISVKLSGLFRSAIQT